MAKIYIGEANYNVVAQELGLEVNVGKKNVVMENDKIYLSGIIKDKEKGTAILDYVGAKKGSNLKCKEIANEVADIQIALDEGKIKLKKKKEQKKAA